VDEVGPHLDDNTDSVFSGEPEPDRGTPHPMLRSGTEPRPCALVGSLRRRLRPLVASLDRRKVEAFRFRNDCLVD
jgi:hypothetical protein